MRTRLAQTMLRAARSSVPTWEWAARADPVRCCLDAQFLLLSVLEVVGEVGMVRGGGAVAVALLQGGFGEWEQWRAVGEPTGVSS